MAENAVPPALVDVVGPLREADEYTRLQGIRQRGLYNIVTGLPMLLFLLPLWFDERGFGYSFSPLGLVVLPLFVIACFPRLFIPLVRRFRPDWTSPLLEADLLKKRLEKLFWIQFPFWLGYLVLIVMVPLVSMRSGNVVDAMDLIFKLDTILNVVFLVAAQAALALHAWMARDRTLAWVFLAWIPFGLLVVLGSPPTQAPSIVGAAIIGQAIATPPIIVGLARMLAPRRWLVR